MPLFLDACRLLENSYLIRQRETGYHHRSIREIVFETCESADGCTMSAMKDLLVPIGGMIGTRDLVSYRNAVLQSFLDGVQPPASAMQMISTALEEIFATDAYVASQVEQVNYLWHRLREGVPLVHPPAAHAVYVDLAPFLPHVAPENQRADA